MNRSVKKRPSYKGVPGIGKSVIKMMGPGGGSILDKKGQEEKRGLKEAGLGQHEQSME